MRGIESYWYKLSPLHLVLCPVSWLFWLISTLRRTGYKTGLFASQYAGIPTIIIGNITVGGTGKTPFTLALAAQLIQQGKQPIIISRGYGGSNEIPQQVLSSSTPAECGDEPVLMAQRQLCPVWVGRNRVATAQHARKQHPECDVILCDDGLQHYRLQRDIEIVLVDSVRKFGNKKLLPAGPLREPISRLKSVDWVVANGELIAEANTQMSLVGDVFYNLQQPSQKVSANFFQGKLTHSIAGIGHPERFFKQLTSLGIKHIPHHFPDHHAYNIDDLRFEDVQAILMTEKDAVKCRTFSDSRCWVLRVDAQLDPNLINSIMRKLSTHGSKTT